MPTALTLGVKVPFDAEPPGPVHVPPASGVPFNPVVNAVAGLEEHSVRPPSIPASGKTLIVTVTVAVSSGHGAVPETV